MLKIKKHLASLTQIPIDQETSELALALLETYALSHRLNLPDAVIAATALRHGLSIYTFNVRDFRFIEGFLFTKHSNNKHNFPGWTCALSKIQPI